MPYVEHQRDVRYKRATDAVTVVLVEDHGLFRQGLGELLALNDPSIEVLAGFETAEQAVAEIPELTPDLVLMDVHLPGIDGVEATRRLVADPGGPVVVLLSTYDEDQVDLLGCGATAYVAKGAFGPDRLSAVWAGAGRHGQVSEADRDLERQAPVADDQRAADGGGAVHDPLDTDAP